MRQHQTPDADVAVTPAELRAPDLPLQSLGGYSRAETNRLLDRAAKSLEQSSSSTQAQISNLQAALDLANRRLAEEASREPASVEQAVGEVFLTAHRAAEVVRNEAKQEADALLVAARAEAQALLAEAKRQTEELEAAKARVEDTLVKAQEEARASREDAEREIAELHAEAHRVRLVIDEFRSEWTLISDALRELELRFPSADASPDTAESLQDELVLVDPELGELVRARLPETIADPVAPARSLAPEIGAAEEGAVETRTRLGLAEAQAEAQPARADAPDHELVLRAPRRRTSRLFVRPAGFAVAFAVIAAVTLAFAESQTSRETVLRSVVVKEPRPTPLQRAGTRRHGASTSAVKSGAPPVAVPHSSRAAAAPPTFVWAPQPGAVGYEVQFFKGRTRILVRRTGDPRLTLRSHWVYGGRHFSLTSGRYHWYVWSIRPAKRAGGRAVKQQQAIYASAWTFP